METEKAKEIMDIFRQLTPTNQQQLMTMVRVAETAENNIKNSFAEKDELLCDSDKNDKPAE